MLPGVVPGSPGGTDLISNGIANILTTIGTLAQAGAEHFLVPNMPDLGLTPAFAGTPQAALPELSDRYFQQQPGGTADGPRCDACGRDRAIRHQRLICQNPC